MKNLRGDAPKTENNDDCRALAPFVMALFDGEADETEARRARAHLLICQTCARRWLDWNHSRDLIRCVSVPSPPPQLLWRVLMACRVTLSPQNTPRREAVPNDFSSQILARTTRASHSASPVVFSSRATPRFKVSSLAVPALAMWMMVLQRDVWLPTPVSPPATTLSRVTPANSTSPASRTVVSSVPQRSKLQPSSSRTPRVAAEATPALVTDSSASPVDRPPILAPQPEQRQPLSREVEREVAAALPVVQVERFSETSFNPRDSEDFESAVPFENPEDSRISSQETFARAPRRAVTVRLAALSGSNRSPRLRTTRWKSAPQPSLAQNLDAVRETRSPSQDGSITQAPQALRVSLPNASAPQPARLLAENFDADDNSVEEVRSVVDDFRATLGPDENNAEVASDDDSAN